jgi:hypothetical protein
MINVYSVNGQNVAAPFNLSPSAVAGGAWNTQLISSFDREMFKPVYLPNTINRHPRTDKFYFTDLVKYLGFQIPVIAGENGEYGHFEKDRTIQSLLVSEDGFAGAGGAGAAVTFQLDPTTVYVDAPNGYKFSYARLRQLVHFQFDHLNIVNARITAISNAPLGTQQITIVPDDASVNLLALLGGAGEGGGRRIALHTNAYAEGSRNGQALQPRYATYKNQLQIIKEDSKRTGSSATRGYRIENVEYEFDGQRMVAYELVGGEEVKGRLKLERDGAILFGTIADNYFENDASAIEPELVGMPVRTTQGLLPFAMQNGNTLPYTPTAFSIADIDAVNDILDAEAAPLNYIWAYGSPFGQELREVLKEYFKDDVAAKYVMGEMFGNVESEFQQGLATAVGFQSIQLMPSPRKFHFKHISSFDDPQMMGGADYTYKKMYFCMPYGTFRNEQSKAQMTQTFGEGYNGTEMPYFGYTYSAKNGYSREMEMWETGAAGGEGRKIGKYTDDFDVERIHYRGEFGAWAGAGNLWVVGHPAII